MSQEIGRQKEDLVKAGTLSAPSLLASEGNEGQSFHDNDYLRSPATASSLCPPVFRAIATSCGCYDLVFVLFCFVFLSTSVNK